MSTLPKKLYKTTIVIWTDYDPSRTGMEIDDLAREAMVGDGLCSSQETDVVTDKRQFPDTDFFGSEEESE